MTNQTTPGKEGVPPSGKARRLPSQQPAPRAPGWLMRKPLEAWRSLPVRLILIFIASLIVMMFGVGILAALFPPQENMTALRIYVYAMMAVVVAGCYLAVRRLFYPLQDIRIGARRIGEGQLEYRIPYAARTNWGGCRSASTAWRVKCSGWWTGSASCCWR